MDIQMGWGQYSCKDVGAANIPGYKKRAYYNYNTEWIRTGKSKYNSYSLIVVVYQNPGHIDDVLTSLYIRQRDDDTIHPITRNILERYIPSDSSTVNLVDIGGVTYVKGLRLNYRGFYRPITVSNVDQAYGAYVAAKWFDEMIWQTIYPSVNSREAAKEVIQAYRRFNINCWDISSGKFKKSNEENLNKIKELKHKIAVQYGQMEVSANASADAMNELSEKWGIEVDLSSDD